jgi:hypothetical protein
VYGVLATFGGIPSFNISQPSNFRVAEPLSGCTAIKNKAPGKLAGHNLAATSGRQQHASNGACRNVQPVWQLWAENTHWTAQA